MVDDVLRDAGVALPDVDFIAFGAGLARLPDCASPVASRRTGVGCRQARDPRSNLHALAARLFSEAPDVSTVLCAIDARMHEAYCAVYRRGADPVEVLAPSLARSDSSLSSLVMSMQSQATR